MQVALQLVRLLCLDGYSGIVDIEYFNNAKITRNKSNRCSASKHILDDENNKELKEYIQSALDHYFQNIYQPANYVKEQIC